MTAGRIFGLAYGLIGVCLVAAAIRTATLPSGSCIAVTNRPTGWSAIAPGLFILIIASLLTLTAAVGRLTTHPRLLHWLFVALAGGELAAAICLVIFASAKTAHYYDCG